MDLDRCPLNRSWSESLSVQKVWIQDTQGAGCVDVVKFTGLPTLLTVPGTLTQWRPNRVNLSLNPLLDVPSGTSRQSSH